MQAKKQYDLVQINYIKPYLECNGFRKRCKWDYEAWRDDCMCYVGFTPSKLRGQDALEITIGVSVGFPRIIEFWGDSHLINAGQLQDPRHPRLLGGELMLLSRGGVDAIRVIDHKVTIDEVAESFIYEIDNFGMPFFDTYCHLANAMEAWESLMFATSRPRGPAYLAAAHWLRGEQAKARSVIEQEHEYHKKRFAERQNPLRERSLKEAERLKDEFERRASEYEAEQTS